MILTDCVSWRLLDAKMREEQDPRHAMMLTAKAFFQTQTPTWFATMTFRNPKVTAQGAVASFQRWLSCYRRRQPDVFQCLVWSVERQRRGTAHIHAILVGSPCPSSAHCARCKVESKPYRTLNESWFRHWGIARWRRYDDSIGNGGLTYVTKYVLSEECEDWGLWEAGKDF